MRKSISLFLAFILSFLAVATNTYGNEIVTNSKASILMEADTGQVLFEQNIDEQLPIASVTKVMTMLLTFEALDKGNINLDDMVVISERASSMGGSQVFLETGEQQSVDTLITSVAVASGNESDIIRLSRKTL